MEEKQVSRLGRLLRRWAEPELQRTSRLLRQANTQLDHVLRENIRLSDLCDEQNNTLLSLQSDNRELKSHIQRLELGNKHQLEVMAAMERRVKDMELKYEHMMGQVFRLQAESGVKPHIPE
jgi:hypothetical protein